MDEQIGFIEFGVLFGKGEKNVSTIAIPFDYMWPLMAKFGQDPEAVKRSLLKVVAAACVESLNGDQVNQAKPSRRRLQGLSSKS